MANPLRLAPQLGHCLNISSHMSFVEASEKFYNAMKSCSVIGSISVAYGLHAQLIFSGLASSLFLQNHLLNMYSKCDSIDDACRVFCGIKSPNLFSWNTMINGLGSCGRLSEAEKMFDEMPERDSVSWTSMMSAYFRNGKPGKTVKLFLLMIDEVDGVPDQHSVTCVMKACASIGYLPLAIQLHGFVEKYGFANGSSVDSSLIDMYIKCGAIDHAERVFRRVTSPTLFCWNSMLYGYFMSSGISSSLNFFHQMPEHDIVSWSTIISLLSQHGFGVQALHMFIDMSIQGLRANSLLYASVLSACTDLNDWDWGRHLHARIVRNESNLDMYTGSGLIDMYAKWGFVESARWIFDNLRERNVVSWTSFIAGVAQYGNGEEALLLFNQMRQVNLAPDDFITATVFGVCSSYKQISLGTQLHGYSIKSGIECSIPVGNALITMYSNCGNVRGANLVFDSMPLRDVISWTAMITAFSLCGDVYSAREYFDRMPVRNIVTWNSMFATYLQQRLWEEGLRLYITMLRQGIKPDSVTFATSLSACADSALLQLGKQIICQAEKSGFSSDASVANCFITVYSRCGQIYDAERVFDSLSMKNLVSWNSMLSGYAQNGYPRRAIDLYEGLLEAGCIPDDISYVSVLMACSHAGLVHEGHHYFDCMMKDHCIFPTNEHFTCMVDLFGRAGLLEQAKNLIDMMPFEPNATVWSAFLSACRNCLNTELAEFSLRKLCELDAKESGIYVLLSNVYMDSGKLEGTGSQIILFDISAGKMVKTYRVFEGIRVHGISSCPVHQTEGPMPSEASFKITVFGERRVKLFTLHFEVVEVSQDVLDIRTSLILLQILPKFGDWVFDVCFLEDYKNSSQDIHHHLAVGCSNNSVHIWDVLKSAIILEVRCSERCLLYSMRLWGQRLEALRVASGTIFNEVVVWKVAHQPHVHTAVSMIDDSDNLGSPDTSDQYDCHQCEAAVICRLSGHQGSILSISWSTDGSRLISVSDDRSARIWIVSSQNGSDNFGVVENISIGPVLFGHSARIWDCCIFDFLAVTAGEDCTCRVWGLDGHELWMTKEHIGRGIWRCLFDPCSFLLVTAGFDSGIKVHQLHGCLSRGIEGFAEEVHKDREMSIVLSIPNSSPMIGLMDSKSEYVRSLRFACEDTIFVATNHGFVYHAKLPCDGSVKFSEVIQVSDGCPIVCMDLLSRDLVKHSAGAGDWIAVGDGKGRMTVVNVFCNGCAATVGNVITWTAEMDRQLLGAYWCKPLGCRYIFTSDPRGVLKLWRLSDPSQASSLDSAGSYDVSLIAEFMSSLGARIMCLDALVEEEVLVCGDLRGNLLLFDLPKSMFLDRSIGGSREKMPPLAYFKGAHGISAVASLSLAGIYPASVEICSTGADGCICYLEYDKGQQVMEFVGMKQVKELSLIQSVSTSGYYSHDLSRNNFAVGFSSVDFVIWNLQTDTKVMQVKCGGWRRPHSYFLSRMPESDSSFAYVKDEIIYVHRHKVPDGEKSVPRNLRLHFHGREIHSLCFIPEVCNFTASLRNTFCSKSIWIATGCEDGTVRLTRYTLGGKNWSMSKLLGEHVGGSAVRSLCFVSKFHSVGRPVSDVPNGTERLNLAVENSFLLISVGAKRVLTSWLLKNQQPTEEPPASFDMRDESNVLNYSTGDFSSMSFKWLSTDMPRKSRSDKKLYDWGKSVKLSNQVPCDSGQDLKFCADAYDNDWRYLAVTAFLVKLSDSRLILCFTVVSCSDATLTLRALVLPHRFWFDVASLVPLSSPVLALQHVVIPFHFCSEGSRNLYIVISGSTDGSVAFWDLSDSIEAFIQQVSSLQLEKAIDCQKRPRTGRGSQGGRWWRSLKVSNRENKLRGDLARLNTKVESTKNVELSSRLKNSEDNSACSQTSAFLKSEVQFDDSSANIFEVMPLHVLNNVHQSGVNCLHVSENDGCMSIEKGFLYHAVSGGDDQALTFLEFHVVPAPTASNSSERSADSKAGSSISIHDSHANKSYSMRFLYETKVASAHSSAVKGIWTDGNWVFSVGLDQRVRCWRLENSGKLTEHSHFIVSVPEPEALDARACGRDCYQIVVAGRGMQVIEFSSS
ncbi:hypothetical protein Dimus_016674 [Dionaea muscipula]